MKSTLLESTPMKSTLIKSTSIPALLLATLTCGPAHAAVTAITGATVHTVGPAGTLENASIVFEDGRIVAVGTDIDVPDNAERIDASGKIVTPGLITPMGQIGLVEVSAVEGTVDYVQRGDQFSASFDVSSAYNPRSTLIATNRIEGITNAVIAPQPRRPDEFGNQSRVFSGLASVVQLGDGDDFLIERGVAVVANLGLTGSELAAGSRAAAFMILRTALDDAKDYAQHVQAYDQGNRRAYSVSQADLETLVAVLDGTKSLLVDVNRANDIAAVVDLAREYGIHLIVVGGVEAWMVADKLAEAHVAVILDELEDLPSTFDRLNSRLDSAALLAAAGVRFAIGANAAAQNHNARNITQSAGIAVANGLSWDDALAAITLAPAEIYGVADRLGSLAPGKDADLVIWSSDPLELTSFPEQVYIHGEKIPMVSRQTLLRDRYMNTTSKKPPAFR